jgi:hypothetical protein
MYKTAYQSTHDNIAVTNEANGWQKIGINSANAKQVVNNWNTAITADKASGAQIQQDLQGQKNFLNQEFQKFKTATGKDIHQQKHKAKVVERDLKQFIHAVKRESNMA